MEKGISRLIAVLVIVMVLVTSVFSDGLVAEAAGEEYEVVNGYINVGSGRASIQIMGTDGSKTLAGKEFEVYKLFDAENANEGESINYTANPAYWSAIQKAVSKAMYDRDGKVVLPDDVTEYEAIDFIQSMNSNPVQGCYAYQEPEGRYSDFRYFVEKVRDNIKGLGNPGYKITVESTNSYNTITIAGLDYGYYIVDETSTHDSKGEDHFASSLCMVSTANPDASIVIKSDYPTLTKKIKEDDNVSLIGNDGWNDIGDYEIGQTVPYKYTSTIPNMNGYDKYYYAWHDSMDEELTFHDSKENIKIVISNGTNNYTVKDSEYSLYDRSSAVAKLDAMDTFVIGIEDIKEIIDREFTTAANLDYQGMYVTLYYEATLNDKAALKTGRPGFENDVRLEFSNEPDTRGAGRTGHTPWDTVVCFTFKMNGLKVNNYMMNLAGARFKLYADAECTKEVYLKDNRVDGGQPSTEDNQFSSQGVVDGYIVINRDICGGNDHDGGTKPADAVEEMESNANGKFVIYGLDEGTYYLKETKAPTGYRCILDPIVLTIKPTYTTSRNDYVAGSGAGEEVLKTLEATAHIRDFFEGEYRDKDNQLTTDVSDGSFNVEIINEIGRKLPVTGSKAMLMLLGIGLVLVGGAVALKTKKKKQ